MTPLMTDFTTYIKRCEYLEEEVQRLNELRNSDISLIKMQQKEIERLREVIRHYEMRRMQQ